MISPALRVLTRRGPRAAIHFAYVCMFFMRKRSISSKTCRHLGFDRRRGAQDLEDRPQLCRDAGDEAREQLDLLALVDLVLDGQRVRSFSDAGHRAVGHQAKVDERGQHPCLAAEDRVDGVARDAGELGDVLHRGAGVAALEEELGRGVEDARPSAGRLLVAQRRRSICGFP